MKLCPRCQSQNRDDAAACGVCSTPFVAGPAQPHELAPNPLGEIVCAHCGLRAVEARNYVWTQNTHCARCNAPLVPMAPLAPLARPDLKRRTARAVIVGVVGIVALVGLGLGGVPIPFLLVGWLALYVGVARAGSAEGKLGSTEMGNGVLQFALANAAAVGIAFVAGIVFVGWSVAHGSCPHVYTFDGKAWQLDADPLSGAFFRGAARDDLVRLEHLREVDGRYRLELRDELRETDAIDAVELLVVDHDSTVDALPSADGRVLGLTGAAPPIAARDDAAADRLADVRAADDVVVSSARASHGDATSTSIVIAFSRPDAPAGTKVALALRAHATPFAEEALARYLGRIGPGLAPLMHLAEEDDGYPFRDRIRDEMRRLGLTMTVELADGDDDALHPIAELDPIGPAVQRSFAVALPELVAGRQGPLRVRLRFTPRFWAIDEARLGVASPLDASSIVHPTLARAPAGDALATVTRADGEHALLAEGDRLALEFPAPPPSSTQAARSVFLRIHGYYEQNLGSGRWLSPYALAAHQLGWRSLAREAAKLAQAHPELVDAR